MVTMPFSKYNVEPNLVEMMRATFHRVCDALQIDGNTESPLAEAVVIKIMQLAKTDEVDPDRLCIDVLAELRTGPGGAVDGGTGRPPNDLVSRRPEVSQVQEADAADTCSSERRCQEKRRRDPNLCMRQM
jgi:hypothetical protein